MPGFLPNYQHDVFVSYARVDDQPLLPGDEDSRWVRTLRQSLQTLLNQRAKGASIWMDIADIAGNQPFTNEIRDGIVGSATLLVILSDGYCESEWCLKELASFVDAAGRSAREGRIFVVHFDEIPFERWPDQLRELNGYPFYEKDTHTGQVRSLAIPKLDAQEKEYFARLVRLRDQMAKQLRSLQSAETKPAAAAAPSLTTEAHTAAALKSDVATTVFLAEVTGDLYEDREQMQTYLTQTGWGVLPTRFYSRSPADFQVELDRDLAQAVLFVQLLGAYPSPRTEGLPQGYEGLQAARAEASGTPILKWRSPTLNAATVRDEQHREVVFADDVLATDLEEFKRIVAEKVRQVVAQTGRAVTSNGERFILLSAAHGDLKVADAIADRLSSHDIAFDIVDDSTPLADVAASDEYDGMMVVYGACPQDWVQQQVRQCRRIMLGKKHRAPECAVFVGPPAQKDPLRCRPPRFHVIEDHDKALLEAYLAAVQQARPSEW